MESAVAPAKRRKKQAVPVKVNGTKLESSVVEKGRIAPPRVKAAPEPEKPYEIPGFPMSEGPVGTPRKINEREPFVVVVLPAGVFQYVWEMVESRSRDDHKRYKAMPSIATAAEGAVAAFRAANVAIHKRKVLTRHGNSAKKG